MELAHYSNQDLLAGVRDLLRKDREVTATLVAYLGEVEERRLHLESGFSSMFDYCVNGLGMSEGEAFRRIVAARLGRRFPVIHSRLASGAVHLSALELLRERLTDENHLELLEAVSSKSKREVEALLAARFPKQDVPSTIRKLPNCPPPAEPAVPCTNSKLALQGASNVHTRERNSARIEPLSAARYKVEFTASATLREKLELCRDLLSHANPSRDLGVVVERAVDLLLAELEKKRLGRTKRPRTVSRQRPAKSGHVTNTTRRRIFERDGLQCTYVSPEGRRCEARAFLEFDHVEPRALGGDDSAKNLRVRCRAHNQLSAEQAFGREHVEARRHFRQQKRWLRKGEDHTQSREVAEQHAPTALDRVRSALTGMGFAASRAQQALYRVESMHEDIHALPVEQLLREAVLAATDHASG